MAEYDNATALVDAATKARLAGYRKMDAFSPIPIHEMDEALGLRRTRLPLLVLIGGILGGIGGFALESWVSAVAYPMNVGGRPLISWPQFIPVTFETTVLGAALTAFFGMWALNKLPQPYHPVFNVKRFAERASQDGMFMTIEANDPKFDLVRTRAFLQQLGAREVNEIEP